MFADNLSLPSSLQSMDIGGAAANAAPPALPPKRNKSLNSHHHHHHQQQQQQQQQHGSHLLQQSLLREQLYYHRREQASNRERVIPIVRESDGSVVVPNAVNGNGSGKRLSMESAGTRSSSSSVYSVGADSLAESTSR